MFVANRQTDYRFAAMDQDRSSLVTDALVTASLIEVWRVFTTDEGYKTLGVPQARIDLRPGGMIWTSYDPSAVLGSEQSIGTEILALELGPMNASMSTRIKHPPKGFPFQDACQSVRTVIRLTSIDPQHTQVHLTMTGYDDSAESQKMRQFFQTGNAWVLNKLQAAHGKP